MSLNPQVDQKKNIYIYIYMIGPEEGRFVRSKYRRKLKLCHLFVCEKNYFLLGETIYTTFDVFVTHYKDHLSFDQLVGLPQAE